MNIPFHPLLFAISPILALYAFNVDKVRFSAIADSLMLSVGVTIVVLGVVKLLVGDWKKAAAITSMLLVSFFSYGHMSGGMSLGNFVVSQEIVALIIFIPFLIISIALLMTTKNNLRTLTSVINLVGIVLIIFSLVRVGAYEISSFQASPDAYGAIVSHVEDRDPPLELPNIYYIILDGYAREDTLKEIYDSDNAGFFDSLKEKGFYVADDSSTNYPQTYLSLASSLNMQYLDEVSAKVGTDSTDRRPLGEMIQDSKVQRFLKSMGYIFVTFTSASNATDKNTNADIYMQYQMDVNEFENMLINTTPLSNVFGKDLQYALHRKKVLYTLEHISDVAQTTSPLFVFGHIMSPHPPFVFDDKGNHIQPDRVFTTADGKGRYPGSQEEYIAQYRDQSVFAGKKVLDAVEKILSVSVRPPIIIIQSDHGPAAFFGWDNPDKEAMKERMSILNAYYLPGDKADILYSSITPVNTFRLIFKEYFDAPLELLEDRNYFASWDRPYQFADVTEIVQGE